MPLRVRFYTSAVTYFLREAGRFFEPRPLHNRQRIEFGQVGNFPFQRSGYHIARFVAIHQFGSDYHRVQAVGLYGYANCWRV